MKIYTGELGFTDTSTCNTGLFYITSANDVYRNNGSYDNSFSYWYLEGPAREGVYATNAYALGERQAADLYNCWLHSSKASYSWGLNIFADAEWGQGWYSGPFTCHCSSSAPWQANVNVISGFTAEAAYLTGSRNLAGVYTSLSLLATYMPGQVWPPDWFVWWGAGGCPGAGGQPAVLQSLTWYQGAMVSWHNYNKAGQCLAGGQGVSEWQYYIHYTSGNHTYQDYDLIAREGLTTCATNYLGDRFCGGYIEPGYGDGTI